MSPGTAARLSRRVFPVRCAGCQNQPDANDADYLSGAFTHITGLLLRQQLDDFKAGKRVNNYVHPKTLSKREKKMLVDFLKAIDDFAKGVHAELTGEVF